MVVVLLLLLSSGERGVAERVLRPRVLHGDPGVLGSDGGGGPSAVRPLTPASHPLPRLLGGEASDLLSSHCRLGGIPLGVITVETRAVELTVPADPANLDSEAKVKTPLVLDWTGSWWSGLYLYFVFMHVFYKCILMLLIYHLINPMYFIICYLLSGIVCVCIYTVL